LKLALAHDLAECIVGDITPFCGVDMAEKRQREDAAMMELSQLAGSGGSELYCLYKVKASSQTHSTYMYSRGGFFSIEIFS
jgi:putative hydrolase of HD superfamily